MKALLLGSYPPPFGGVSVFLKRYRLRLASAGYAVTLIDPGKLSRVRLFLELLFVRKYALISLNYPSRKVVLILWLLGVSSRTEVWDHNWQVLERWSSLERRCFGLFLARCREVVLIAPHLRDYYRRHGVELPATTRVQNSFLPPELSEETQILESYPPEIHQFVLSHKPLLIGNAFKIVFYEGVDLYGLDMCVKLVAKLKESFSQVGLLFALAEIGEERYFERIRKQIVAMELEEHFHFITGQKELWPLFRKADLMVRPTYRDGPAISVAEAIYLGCAAVASDVSQRPEGTLIFANRDDDDFQRKSYEALISRNATHPNISGFKTPTQGGKVLDTEGRVCPSGDAQ